MKRLIIMALIVIGMAVAAPSVFAQSARPSGYNFGDYKSSTLAAKAWQALAAKDLAAVLAYTSKCAELYDAKALAMQAGLKKYPAGDDQQIFAYWALNDMATVYFVLGSAYLQAGDKAGAQEAFEKVVNDYSFGQCYDPAQKAFWKPAVVAKKKLKKLSKSR